MAQPQAAFSSRFFACITLLVLVVGLWQSILLKPSVVLAQTTTNTTPPPSTQGINLTLSPPLLFIDIAPGEVATPSFKVRNNGTETENLKLELSSFKADESGAKPVLVETSPNETFMQWVTFPQDTLTIKPGEWETVQFTFAPPEGTGLAYYYAILLKQAAQAPQDTATKIQGAPALLVLSSIQSPHAKRELNVKSFTTQNQIVEFLPQTFKVAIENTGNVHVVPTGNIFIDGQGKKDLAVLSVNPTHATILPQTTRELHVDWMDGFPLRETDKTPADAARLFGLQWDLTRANWFRFGKYTAHLLLVYDNGERDVPVESLVTFWVIPWRIIGILLLVLLFVGLGFWSVLRSLLGLRKK
jgi:hypothetical protein